jgi:hypothetical protein
MLREGVKVIYMRLLTDNPQIPQGKPYIKKAPEPIEGETNWVKSLY